MTSSSSHRADASLTQATLLADLQAPSLETRLAAIRALSRVVYNPMAAFNDGWLREEPAITALIDGLSDPDPSFVEQVVSVLAGLFQRSPRDQRAVPPVLKLLKSRRARTRGWAGEVVGTALGPAGFEHLFALIRDKDSWVAERVLAIIRTGLHLREQPIPREQFPALLESLIWGMQNGKKAGVRKMACSGLYFLGECAAIPALKQALLVETDDLVRDGIQETLEHLSKSST